MLYSIAEVSDRLNIPASTIRYYEEKGLLPKVKRTSGGIRQFDDEDIEWLYIITCFLKTGMSLATLKRIIDLGLEGDSTIEQRKAILEDHKKDLEKKLLDLQEAIKIVDQKLKIYETKQSIPNKLC
jgi:DNA-binding transcriptional MerR regulator